MARTRGIAQFSARIRIEKLCTAPMDWVSDDPCRGCALHCQTGWTQSSATGSDGLFGSRLTLDWMNRLTAARRRAGKGQPPAAKLAAPIEPQEIE